VEISVAMCTYNGAGYVREQLESIAAQSRPPDELVVCDDNSDDATPEILREFASASPLPVRLRFNERRLGSTKNFEKAIGLCGGDVIALSDQDDYWLPQKLARVEAALSSSPEVGMVFSDAEVVDDGLRPLGYSIWQYLQVGREERESVRAGNAFDLFFSRNAAVGATMAFRSSFRELILPIPGEFNLSRGGGRILIHDGWIALLISATAGVSVIDEPLVKYRQHSGQQVGAKSPREAAASGGGVEALRAAVSRQNFYSAEIGQLEAVRERLAARVPAAACAAALSKLESKIAHLRARAEMPERRSRRLPRVLREVLTLRYHLYSNGVRSAAKDLFKR
jgi:hypothetical protein